VLSIRATRARRTPEFIRPWKPSTEFRRSKQGCGSLLTGPSIGTACFWAQSAHLNQRSQPSVGFCPYRRSVVMQSRGRPEPSVSLVSTPITFHNYRPWSMAITQPASLQPVDEPIENGTGWAGVGAHLSRRYLETRRRPGARLRCSP
jgi:hypothetical protein